MIYLENDIKGIAHFTRTNHINIEEHLETWCAIIAMEWHYLMVKRYFMVVSTNFSQIYVTYLWRVKVCQDLKKALQKSNHNNI